MQNKEEILKGLIENITQEITLLTKKIEDKKKLKCQLLLSQIADLKMELYLLNLDLYQRHRDISIRQSDLNNGIVTYKLIKECN